MQRLLDLRHYLFDVLVSVLLVASIVDAWVAQADAGWRYKVVASVVPAALYLRRFSELGASLLAMALAISTAVIDQQAAYDSLPPFFSIILATWATGLIEDRRMAVVGWAAALATVWTVTTLFPDEGVGDYFWVSFFFSAAWIAAFVVAQRGHHARELAARAARLEAERDTLIREERRRIARELHDVVAHSVSVMTVQAGGVRRLLRPDQEREREALLAVENTGREALIEMRRLLGMLRDTDETPSLAPQPGVASIGALVQAVREAGLPVDYRVKGDPVPLPPGIDVSAYRIVQEALTNTLKHAGPARAEVTVRYGGDLLELEILNDGSAEANGAGGGQGLVGMQERVGLYGGKLEAGPGRDGGYAVRAQLPVKEPLP